MLITIPEILTLHFGVVSLIFIKTDNYALKDPLNQVRSFNLQILNAFPSRSTIYVPYVFTTIPDNECMYDLKLA